MFARNLKHYKPSKKMSFRHIFHILKTFLKEYFLNVFKTFIFDCLLKSNTLQVFIEWGETAVFILKLMTCLHINPGGLNKLVSNPRNK